MTTTTTKPSWNPETHGAIRCNRWHAQQVCSRFPACHHTQSPDGSARFLHVPFEFNADQWETIKRILSTSTN